MKILKNILSLFAVVIATHLLLHSSVSVAQLVVTNGYICAPKNPGDEATRLFFRQTDGAAVNLSRTATFPIVCPVVVHYSDFSHAVGVRVGNGNTFTQNLACALEEYGGGANKVRTYGRSISLPGGFTNSIIWENIRLASYNTGNYLVVRCILPPLGYITTVAWNE